MAPLISIVHLNYDASFVTITNRNRPSLLMCGYEDFTIKGIENIVGDSRKLQLALWNFDFPC